jgi:uncharacterized protein (UPF0332 family)
MTGRDFLNQARRLQALSGEEDWRTAVSRAYYAAFHIARDFLEDLRFRVPKSDRAHAYLWLRLQNCGDGAISTAGSDLNELRSKRNIADYDLQATVSAADALQWVDLAEQIILALEAAAADPARASAIQAEVIRYERDVLHDVTFVP